MLYVVIGPPCGGKSTWCKQQAQSTDLIIDYDRIAQALTTDTGETDPHDHTPAVKAVAKAARQAAIDKAITLTDTDVYLIHSTPSPALLARYRSHGAHIEVIDPGPDVVMQRCKRERPWQMQQVVKRWYADSPALLAGLDEPAPGAPIPAKRGPRKRNDLAKTDVRGYDYRHRQLRERMRPTVEAGGVTCWRCIANGLPPDQALILPGTPWDVGHDDDDRTRYRGPEHRACNRATATRRKTSGPVDDSREW